MRTVLVTGYAKAPQGTVLYEKGKLTGVVLEISLQSNLIVNAEFMFVTNLAKDFFKRQIIGYNLTEGLDDLVDNIERSYFAPSTNSIVVALKAAFRRYEEHKSKYIE